MDIAYYKRRLKANKMRRQIMSTRRFLQRIRVFLALLIIAGLCYGGILILKSPQWYLDSTKLANLDKSIIKIQGNNITPEDKILNMVKNTKLPYTQIYRLDTRPLAQNIEKLQPIKKTYIKRYWFPARIIIAVEERVPVFLLTPNLDTEPNSALTADGILIGKEYLPFKIPQKAITVLTYGIKNGHEEIWDKKKVEKLLEIIKAFEGYSRLEVKYLDIRNEKDCYVMLGDFLIRFGEMNDTVLARIKWIAPIIPEANKNKDNIKYIDLRWEDSRYFCLKNTQDKKIESPEKEIIKEDKSENKKEDKKIIKPIKQEEVKPISQQEEVKIEENTQEQNN